jgi:hypothetical protein
VVFHVPISIFEFYHVSSMSVFFVWYATTRLFGLNHEEGFLGAIFQKDISGYADATAREIDSTP